MIIMILMLRPARTQDEGDRDRAPFTSILS